MLLKLYIYNIKYHIIRIIINLRNADKNSKLFRIQIKDINKNVQNNEENERLSR